jgi:CRP/FNR family nitrogen fixation transcriptional regulator
MLVNINAASAGRQSALGELGELSRARVILSEFKYNRGTEIYGEAEPADYIYQVVEGAVRSYKLLSDGRRQIGAFHLIGDVFGLENGSTHRFTTEAIVDTTVRLIKRRSLEHVAEADVLVALDILNMTTSSLQHAEDHMLLLERKTSLERVAAFLIEMDRRLTAAGVVRCRRTKHRNIRRKGRQFEIHRMSNSGHDNKKSSSKAVA